MQSLIPEGAHTRIILIYGDEVERFIGCTVEERLNGTAYHRRAILSLLMLISDVHVECPYSGR